jgi:hypothetical protein
MKQMKSTVWCSRERLPAAAAQPAQGSSEPVAPRIYLFILDVEKGLERNIYNV